MELSASVWDFDTALMEGVLVQEINALGFPANFTKTDENGKFSLKVSSASSVIRLSFPGYKTIEVAAGKFGSYQEMQLNSEVLDNVEVKNNYKDSSNTTGLVIVGLLCAGALAYALWPDNKSTVQKSQPKKVTV